MTTNGLLKPSRSSKGSSHPYRRQVKIARTRVGRGVFAKKSFLAGTMVGEIEGEVIFDTDYGSDYCMSIGDDRVMEPGAPFRYLNHCCDPNCEFDWYDLRESPGEPPQRRVFLFALQDVQVGDELTIDYNWAANDAIKCSCGSPACRGWIVCEDERELLID